MKTVVFFITHKTLGFEHACATLGSIAKQSLVPEKKFDKFYIYNTHSEELSNQTIEELYYKLKLDRFFNELTVFDYHPSTHKSLGADVNNICSYMKNHYQAQDRFLLLKSDCVLSKNYFNDLIGLPESQPVYFVAPWICAKERISDQEIFQYSQRDNFVRSDKITFFVEDQTNSENNDFYNRPGVQVTDEEIKFTSCCVITDFSCHYLSVQLIPQISINFQSWGGVNFGRLRQYYIGTEKSFVIHKFHNIMSENRFSDREGPVAQWLSS